LKRQLGRWRFLLLGALAILAIFALAACKEGYKGLAVSDGDPAPPEEQVLVVQSLEPEFFDPHRSNFEQDIAIERMLFRGLYQLVATEDGGVEAVPSMAEGEPEIDGNVYTVTLRDGLLWSDDVPLIAQHFVDGMLRSCDPEVASPYQYLLGEGYLNIVGCDEYFYAFGTAAAPITPTPEELQALRDAVGVKALDDRTIELTLTQPKITFTTIMSLWATFPARLDIIQQFGERWTDPGNIVGNGPYILTEFVAKDHVTLEPNPNWPLEPTPLLQRLTIRFIDDFAVAFRAYQTGELDISQFPVSEIPTVEGDPTLSAEYLKVGAGRIDAIQMQLEDPTLAIFEVRLALSRAIDRELLNNVVSNDAHIPAVYEVVQGLSGHQGNAPFEDIVGYNPDAAKQALADAGFPNGEGFPTLTLTLREDPEQKALGEFLQKQWKDILNINVELVFVDGRTRAQRFNTEDFQLFRGGWQLDYPDPENVLIGRYDRPGANNKYNCSDDEIDAKLLAAGRETDNDARIQLLQEAETLVVTKLCGVAPLRQLALLYLVKPKVGGVRPNGTIDAAMPGNWCAECWYIEEQ